MIGTNKNEVETRIFQTNGFEWNLAFSSDACFVFGGRSGVKKINIWNAISGELSKQFPRTAASMVIASVSTDKKFLICGTADSYLQLWDINNGKCNSLFSGCSNGDRIAEVGFSHHGDAGYAISVTGGLYCFRFINGDYVQGFAARHQHTSSAILSANGEFAIAGTSAFDLHHWQVQSGKSLANLKGHTSLVRCLTISSDDRFLLSGSDDHTIRFWDIGEARCLRILEGHTGSVCKLAVSADGRYAISGATDKTARFWDVFKGICLREFSGFEEEYSYKKGADEILVDEKLAILSVGINIEQGFLIVALENGSLRRYDIRDLLVEHEAQGNYDYSNAKVLVVGDSGVGKTALTERLIMDTFTPCESTSGAWATQWVLDDATANSQREVWLWDFSGQADQRLVHQLFMEHASLILLIFNADNEDVFPVLREWQTVLQMSVADTPIILVGSRIDVGFRASSGKCRQFAKEHGYGYFETSAKDGRGCAELRQAIKLKIDWESIPRRTSPLIFKQIKDEIIKLRNEQFILHTRTQLQAILRERLPLGARFDQDIFETVLGLLDGPGFVKKLGFGDYILLKPEWVNAYAQTVIRTIRADDRGLGCLPLGSITDGKLLFHEMGRLPAADEAIILREMERQLEARFVCFRQGGQLVFPSHCGREREDISTYSDAAIEFSVRGYLDSIYATLIVNLASAGSCQLDKIWRDAADFHTLVGQLQMGVRLIREGATFGKISLYFNSDVSVHDRVIFANIIHLHLDQAAEVVQRVRHYACSCGMTKSPPLTKPDLFTQRLMREGESATVVCDDCSKPIQLWDELEGLFWSDALKEEARELVVKGEKELDNRRKGELLVDEVMARIHSNNHKVGKIDGVNDEGIDLVLEFTDEKSQGTGKYLYLQLKAGNSHLRKLQFGITEMFDIVEPRWVKYWLKQPAPVMLVIGTFAEGAVLSEETGKLPFDQVRWMNISEALEKAKAKGKSTKSVVFKGEEINRASIQKMYEECKNTKPT